MADSHVRATKNKRTSNPRLNFIRNNNTEKRIAPPIKWNFSLGKVGLKAKMETKMQIAKEALQDPLLGEAMLISV